jgi:hypothetical protein
MKQVVIFPTCFGWLAAPGVKSWRKISLPFPGLAI